METLTWDERRAIEQAEETRRTKAFSALVTAICKQMPGWTLKPPDPENANLRDIIVKDGMSIHFGQEYNKKDRMTIGTWGWPEYTYWNDRGEPSKTSVTPRDLWEPKEDSPSITVAMNRGADAIVREIKNRFLPEYERIYQRCLDRAIKSGTTQINERQHWIAVCEYLGQKPKYNSTHADTKSGRIDVQKRHSDIHIEMDVSLATLKRIIQALNSTDEA